VKREVIERAPLVRVTLDDELRERVRALLHEIFNCHPSGRVILNANDGGVLHAELEAKKPRADKQ
jgi:hypothetical protein